MNRLSERIEPNAIDLIRRSTHRNFSHHRCGGFPTLGNCYPLFGHCLGSKGFLIETSQGES
jgi:hypothetical protein